MNDIPELIVQILNGSQAEEEMRLFMKWYDESADNKELYFQLKQINDLLKKDQVPDKDELLESWNRLADKIRTAKGKSLDKPAISIRATRKFKFAAVAAVALIFIFVGIRFNITNKTLVEVSSFFPKEVKVVELPDGSTVHLNASSTLMYPKRFNKKSREVHLDGEAYFSVVENSNHPFVVRSHNIEIEVLGTEFNVLSYSEDDIASATLISGKVKFVTHESIRDVYNEIILEPGYQAIFDKVSNTTEVVDVKSEDAISWMSGRYSFSDASLEEITHRLERIYDVTFVIDDESLKRKTFTGKFFAGQTVEEIVEIINFKNQFRYKINNDTVYLTHK